MKCDLIVSCHLGLSLRCHTKLTLYISSGTVPNWAVASHPVRVIASGRPAFTLYRAPWSNNVSGNVSKQYNVHTNMYLANLNLPHGKLQQEFFVHFHSTSQHASSSEQFCVLYKEVSISNPLTFAERYWITHQWLRKMDWSLWLCIERRHLFSYFTTCQASWQPSAGGNLLPYWPQGKLFLPPM